MTTLAHRRVLLLGAVDALALDIARTFSVAGSSLSFGFDQSEGDAVVARISTSGLAPERMRSLDFGVSEHLNAQLKSFTPLDIVIYIPRWNEAEVDGEATDETIDKALTQNVLEAGFVLQALTNYFSTRESVQGVQPGRIIVPLSLRAQFTKADVLGASHAALGALCRQAASELALAGVTLNTILIHIAELWQTGSFHTPLQESLKNSVGTLHDVSEACRYLASASYVTGSQLTIDGGYSLIKTR